MAWQRIAPWPWSFSLSSIGAYFGTVLLPRPFVKPNGPRLVHFGLEVSSAFAVGEEKYEESIEQQLSAKFSGDTWVLKRI